MKIKAGVVGATGYTGTELLRILANHEDVEVTEVFSQSSAGKRLSEVVPHLADHYCHLVLSSFSAEDASADAYFVCLPHGSAQQTVKQLIEHGKKVIDLSADFRLKDISVYESVYGVKHCCPELVERAVYGMPEFKAGAIKKAQLVANPGCLARASILALYPAVKHGILKSPVVVDAKTGVTGAGKRVRQDLHFPEMNEDLRPYAPLNHRHEPEIIQEAGLTEELFFVPHLVPVDRGIVVSAYFKGSGAAEIYRDFYADSPFVKVIDRMPSVKNVRGTNQVELSVVETGGKTAVFVALDNLVSGASGNAVHCFNIMHGLDETSGLSKLIPLRP